MAQHSSFQKCAFVVAIILVASGLAAGQSRLHITQTYCLGATAPCVLTYHNNTNRDGVNPYESVLKASALSAHPPSPQWMYTTDGLVYAQPLYVHKLSIASVQHNVVFVVTENNTIYALDADTSK
jgi:hypothetical protein